MSNLKKSRAHHVILFDPTESTKKDAKTIRHHGIIMKIITVIMWMLMHLYTLC